MTSPTIQPYCHPHLDIPASCKRVVHARRGRLSSYLWGSLRVSLGRRSNPCRHMLQHMRLLLEILKISFFKELIFYVYLFITEMSIRDFVIGTTIENETGLQSISLFHVASLVLRGGVVQTKSKSNVNVPSTKTSSY